MLDRALQRFLGHLSSRNSSPGTVREYRRHVSQFFAFLGVLVLIEAYDEKLDLASRNLPGVSVLAVSAVDPVSLVRHQRVLATVGAVRMLEEKLA